MNDPTEGPPVPAEPDLPDDDDQPGASAGPSAPRAGAEGAGDDDNNDLDDDGVGGNALDKAWDAADPRRRGDQMAPPTEPCECYCLHCGRTFSSDQIWFQKVIGSRDGFDGFWMCPTPNCGGAGFTFDIFPTDPEHPANAGWSYSDDDDDEEGGWDDETGNFLPGGEADADKEYDPDEPTYKSLDEVLGDEDEDDDLEGEEWKYGLQPGERPEPQMTDEGRVAWEAEQKKYEMPDERPRELDWTNKEEEERPGRPTGDWRDDDIPF